MILTAEQIKAVTNGAVEVAEEADGIHFHRFTEEQEIVYQNMKPDFYAKCFATAGIRLEFKTNSTSLLVKTKVSSASSRKFFSLDVLVDGKVKGYLDNFSEEELPEYYSDVDVPLGSFSKCFPLGEGEKTVTIYLPWSVKTVMEELSVDDGAYVLPVKREKKLLVYGDSITHGYDALRPSHRYAAQIADAFGLEEVNRGIGGEQFFPALAEKKDAFVPDYIMVAYGTNDWDSTTREKVKEHALGFFLALTKNYPDTPIFALTPIWRMQYDEERVFGPFTEVDGFMREILSDYKNITVIRGYDFIPKDESYFADRIVHPNDCGFEHYFKNLYEELKKYIVS